MYAKLDDPLELREVAGAATTVRRSTAQVNTRKRYLLLTTCFVVFVL